MDRRGLDSRGVDRPSGLTGMEWNGMEWNGMEWVNGQARLDDSLYVIPPRLLDTLDW